MVRLIPRDEKFYDLFIKEGETILEAARELESMVTSFDRLGERVAAIQALEKRGDQIDDEIETRLERSFVTPFDREDIHALAEELDDVVDDMLEVAHLLELGDRDVAAMPELKQQAGLLGAMPDEVASSSPASSR